MRIKRFFIGVGIVLLGSAGILLGTGFIMGIAVLLTEGLGFHPLLALLTAVVTPAAIAGGIAHAVTGD